MSAQQNQLKDLTEEDFRSFTDSYSYKPVSRAVWLTDMSQFSFGSPLNSTSNPHWKTTLSPKMIAIEQLLSGQVVIEYPMLS